jgi:hypothetical protein
MSQNDFEIKVEVATGGKVVKIKQLTGVSAWDPMFGSAYGNSVEPVVLTPYEAEQLVAEIKDAIKVARTK